MCMHIHTPLTYMQAKLHVYVYINICVVGMSIPPFPVELSCFSFSDGSSARCGCYFTLLLVGSV